MPSQASLPLINIRVKRPFGLGNTDSADGPRRGRHEQVPADTSKAAEICPKGVGVLPDTLVSVRPKCGRTS